MPRPLSRTVSQLSRSSATSMKLAWPATASSIALSRISAPGGAAPSRRCRRYTCRAGGGRAPGPPAPRCPWRRRHRRRGSPWARLRPTEQIVHAVFLSGRPTSEPRSRRARAGSSVSATRPRNRRTGPKPVGSGTPRQATWPRRSRRAARSPASPLGGVEDLLRTREPGRGPPGPAPVFWRAPQGKPGGRRVSTRWARATGGSCRSDQGTAQNLRPTDNADARQRRAEGGQGFLERRAGGVPQQSLVIAGICGERRDRTGQHQPVAQGRARLVSCEWRPCTTTSRPSRPCSKNRWSASNLSSSA